MTKIILAITLAILVFAGCAKTPDSSKEIQKSENITQEAPKKENTPQEVPKKNENDTQTAQNENTATPENEQKTSSEQQEISEESVKKFVLTLVQGASEKDIREFKKEYDDGKLVYDIKVVHNKMEYEFEIDAHTGEIISWDSESIYD